MTSLRQTPLPDAAADSGVHAQQARSRRTEEALLQAAFTLFRERGVDAVTVADIAAAAAVAPATIYRRFGDKEGLLRATVRRFTTQALELVALTPGVRSHDDFIACVADVLVVVWRFTQGNQNLLRSVYAKALSDDFYADCLLTLRRSVFAALRAHFLAHAAHIRHPQPQRAVEFTLRQAVAMLSARLEASRLEVNEGAMSDAAFLRELVLSMLAYLQVPHSEDAIDRALRARGL